MKNLKIAVCVLLLVSLCSACGHPISKDTSSWLGERGEAAQTPERVATDVCDTREEYDAALTALVGKYEVQDDGGDFATCRLILLCEEEIDLSGLGAAEVLVDPDGVYILQFTDAQQAEATCNALADADGVTYVEPDVLMSIDAIGRVGREANSWGTAAIDADVFAAALSRTGYDPVTVAVVDTGVSAHEFLDGRLLAGKDIFDNDSDPSDENGHGTHVAGIIVDATAGLDIDILPIRVLGPEGRGSVLFVAEGVRSAANAGADVINLSLGSDHSSYLDSAIEYASEKGITVVASAGNDKKEIVKYCPAHIESCITVSAVDENNRFCSFSNYGSCVDFCAPGEEILSCVPDGYEYMSGTSMAAPYISALAAMLKASGLASTTDEIVDKLASCALDLGDTSWDSRYGCGLPQMSGLVDELGGLTEGPDEPAERSAVDLTDYEVEYIQTILAAVHIGGNILDISTVSDADIALYTSNLVDISWVYDGTIDILDWKTADEFIADQRLGTIRACSLNEVNKGEFINAARLVFGRDIGDENVSESYTTYDSVGEDCYYIPTRDGIGILYVVELFDAQQDGQYLYVDCRICADNSYGYVNEPDLTMSAVLLRNDDEKFPFRLVSANSTDF